MTAFKKRPSLQELLNASVKPKKTPRAKRPSDIRRAEERARLREEKKAREAPAFKVVNVMDPGVLSGYLETHEAERLVRNVIRRDSGLPPLPDLDKDSGDKFLDVLQEVADEDVAGLKKAQESYGNSWKKRGGVGAWMMLCRKWDRLEERLKRPAVGERGIYDVFAHIAADQRAEGVIDDVRDLRRYLLLVESELRARGFKADHRDNKS